MIWASIVTLRTLRFLREHLDVSWLVGCLAWLVATGPSRVAPTPQGNPTTNQSETSLVSDAPWTKEAEEGPKSSSPRAIRF